MRKYPLEHVGHRYRGNNLQKRAKADEWTRIASLVVDYINNDLANLKFGSKMYSVHRIADAIYENSETVRSVLARLDGGSNGITCYIGNYEDVHRPSREES
jgi:hypothetical protein